MTEDTAHKGAGIEDHEDDFELVQNHGPETDDLSSITSNAGETDNEAESGDEGTQAGSNVTLRMPNLERSEEIEEKSAMDSSHKLTDESHLVWNYTSWYHKINTRFDLKEGETVTLPILYIGPQSAKRIVVQKLADVLRENFTEDVWKSDSYSILPGPGSVASVVPESRIKIALVTNAAELGKYPVPVLSVRILGWNGESTGQTSEPSFADRAADIRRVQRIPYLPLQGKDADPFVQGISYHSEDAILCSTVDPDHVGRTKTLTIESFQGLATSELSEPILRSLDAWDHRVRMSKASKGAVMKLNLGLKLLPLLLMCLAPLLYSFVTSHGRNMIDGSTAANRVGFHQLTWTNALVELPPQYRLQRGKPLPQLTARVTRDGKTIKSHMDLVVDNLYSLSWPHEETYGELMIAVESLSNPEVNDAYVVQYSSKTPFIQAISDKIRDLNHLGHLAPEVDIGRRVQELLKQVDGSKSYVIKTSRAQLQNIRDHGSIGLKRMQDDYSIVLDKTSATLRNALASGGTVSHWFGDVLKTHTGRQYSKARKGFQRLRRLQSKTRPSKWYTKAFFDRLKSKDSRKVK